MELPPGVFSTGTLDLTGPVGAVRGASRIAGYLDEVIFHPQERTPPTFETVTLTADPIAVEAMQGFLIVEHEWPTERQASEAMERLLGFGFTEEAAEDAADALFDNYMNPAGLLEDLARVEEARDLGNVTNQQIRDAIDLDIITDTVDDNDVGPWTQFLDENGLIPFPYEGVRSEPPEAAEALPGGRGPVTPQNLDPAHRAALSNLVNAADRALSGLTSSGLMTEAQVREFGNILGDALSSDTGGWADGQTCPNCGDGTLMVHHGDNGTIVECLECHRDPRLGPADVEAEIRAAGQRLADRLAAQRGSD